MDAKLRFELEETLAPEAAALHLELLAAALRRRRVDMAGIGLPRSLSLPDEVELTIEVRYDPDTGRTRLELKLAWWLEEGEP